MNGACTSFNAVGRASTTRSASHGIGRLPGLRRRRPARSTTRGVDDRHERDQDGQPSTSPATPRCSLVVTDGGDGNRLRPRRLGRRQAHLRRPRPADTTPPTVTATTPGRRRDRRGHRHRPVTATFSEALERRDRSRRPTFTPRRAGQLDRRSRRPSPTTPRRMPATLTPTTALTAATDVHRHRSRAAPAGSPTSPATRSRPTSPWSFTTAPARADRRPTSPTSRLHHDRQRLGPGREGHEQRRAGRRRRPADHPQRRAVYAKGLGVHAASDLRYALNGDVHLVQRRRSGVDDEVGSLGTVDFQVFADGTKRLRLRRGDRRERDQDPHRRPHRPDHRSQLVVTDGGDGIAYDHGDWADAKITCGS